MLSKLFIFGRKRREFFGEDIFLEINKKKFMCFNVLESWKFLHKNFRSFVAISSNNKLSFPIYYGRRQLFSYYSQVSWKRLSTKPPKLVSEKKLEETRDLWDMGTNHSAAYFYNHVVVFLSYFCSRIKFHSFPEAMFLSGLSSKCNCCEKKLFFWFKVKKSEKNLVNFWVARNFFHK